MKYHRLKTLHDLLSARAYPSMTRLVDEVGVCARQVTRNLRQLAQVMGAPILWCPRRLGYHYKTLPTRSLAVAAGLAPSSMDNQELAVGALQAGQCLLVSASRGSGEIVVPVDLSVRDGRLVLVGMTLEGRELRHHDLSKVYLEELDPADLKLSRADLRRLQADLRSVREAAVRRAAEEIWFGA